MAAGFKTPTLGLLQLTQRPVLVPGAVSDPAAHPYPIRAMQVPGADPDTVLGEDPHIHEAYIACARELEAEGVAAITSNCGFTARFQRQVAAAVTIPVALSSLLLVPFAARLLPPGGRIGIVTYDSDKLTERFFEGAGWSSSEIPVAVDGIQGTESWRELSTMTPNLSVAMVERDVVATVERQRREYPDIRAIVLECSVFPIAGRAVRAATGLPVLHFRTLAAYLMATVTEDAPGLSAAAE